MFRTVAAVGDAWSWLVLREAVLHGVSRFDEFQRNLGIARSTLVARLDQLVGSGILYRDGVDYRPTDWGVDFLGALLTAMWWGDRWFDSGGRRPVRVTHRTCGEPMHVEMSCEHCGEPVHARDVTFDRLPLPATRGSGPAARTRMPDLELLERRRPCSIARTLQAIGDQWSALIIQESFFGTHRFDAFQNRLAIASNILSQRLKRLAELGVLEAQSTGEHRGYHLTDKGLDLYPVALAMLTWGDHWLSTGKPPIALTHTGCGARLTAIPTCSQCRNRITLNDLDFQQRRIGTT